MQPPFPKKKKKDNAVESICPTVPPFWHRRQHMIQRNDALPASCNAPLHDRQRGQTISKETTALPASGNAPR